MWEVGSTSLVFFTISSRTPTTQFLAYQTALAQHMRLITLSSLRIRIDDANCNSVSEEF
jgi:hypothetical protein